MTEPMRQKGSDYESDRGKAAMKKAAQPVDGEPVLPLTEFAKAAEQTRSCKTIYDVAVEILERNGEKPLDPEEVLPSIY